MVAERPVGDLSYPQVDDCFDSPNAVGIYLCVFADLMWDAWSAAFTFIFGAIFCGLTLVMLVLLRPWKSVTPQSRV